MTQYYILGEFSLLLGDLTPERGDSLHDEVEALRHRVEQAPICLLHGLAQEALDLTDAACWNALDHGDTDAFCRYVKAATALAEFGVDAGLLP